VKFFDVGQEATGFIAIGQIATGFIAIGQMATGVIAIGQLARGVVAVGMGAIGLVSVGMLSGGVVHATGMLGMSGMPGKGLILPLMPFPRSQPFDVKKRDELLSQRVAGWVRATLSMGSDRVPKLMTDAGELPAVVTLELTQAARDRAAEAESDRGVLAYLEPPTTSGSPWTAERLVALPAAATSVGLKLFVWAVCFTLLSALSAAFWELVAIPLVEAVLSAK
jgi:hypothetical protein